MEKGVSHLHTGEAAAHEGECGCHEVIPVHKASHDRESRDLEFLSVGHQWRRSEITTSTGARSNESFTSATRKTAKIECSSTGTDCAFGDSCRG